MAGFIKISAEILQDKRLNPTQILLYGIIMSLSKKEGYCRASNKTISEMMGIGIWAVQNGIKKLKSEGFIDVEIEENNRRKIKVCEIPQVCEISQGCENSGGVENHMGVCEISHGGMGNFTPKYINEYISTKVDIIPPKKNEGKSTTNGTPKRTTNEHLLVGEKKEQFQKFWETYPHFTGRSSRKKSIPPFLQLDAEQVQLGAALLKWEIAMDSRQGNFVKAAELWLKNFTPINESQKQRKLMSIFEWHMKQKDGKRERMEELMQDFPNVDFKRMREELSEKNSLLHKMTFT